MNAVDICGRQLTPSKILCVGRNYVEHIEELGNEIPDEMVIFGKPNSSISNVLMAVSEEPLHYEAELAFAVENGSFTAVGLGLDLTRRELQSKLKAKGLPWERAKAFDGSAVFSPFVAFEDMQNLSLVLGINGIVAQSGGVGLMMYKPDDILAELKRFTSLENGDIVMTGTPKGVGVVSPGDSFSGEVREGGKTLLQCQWVAR